MTRTWLVEERVPVGAWRGHWFMRKIAFATRGQALAYIAGLVENAGARRQDLRTVKFVRVATQPLRQPRTNAARNK